jgi:hypothetical protein
MYGSSLLHVGFPRSVVGVSKPEPLAQSNYAGIQWMKLYRWLTSRYQWRLVPECKIAPTRHYLGCAKVFATCNPRRFLPSRRRTWMFWRRYGTHGASQPPVSVSQKEAIEVALRSPRGGSRPSNFNSEFSSHATSITIVTIKYRRSFLRIRLIIKKYRKLNVLSLYVS